LAFALACILLGEGLSLDAAGGLSEALAGEAEEAGAADDFGKLSFRSRR